MHRRCTAGSHCIVSTALNRCQVLPKCLPFSSGTKCLEGRRSPAYSSSMSMRSRDRPVLTGNQNSAAQTPSTRFIPPQKAQVVLELMYVATHMVPPVVLHCLNILTMGEYNLAGWFSAHQLIMTILSYMSPYIPLSRYQQYLLRLPFNVLITLLFWKVVGISEFTLTRQSAIVGAVLGVLSTFLWVGGPKLISFGKSKRRPWDPYSRHEGVTAHSIVAIRLFNSSVFTPFFEEVYDRGFLYRAFFNLLSGWQYSSFQSIPLKAVSVMSLAASTLCFGAGHTRFDFEPVLGMMFGLYMHALVFYYNSLGPAVLAHAVCNLMLGSWVICMGDWIFW